MRTWKDVATLVKTRGLNGRLVVRCAAGLPLVLQAGMEVAFVPPQTDCPRTAVVSFVKDIDAETAEVDFEGIDDDAVARQLVGCHCLVKRASLDGLVLVDDTEALEHWDVYDGDQLIGSVAAMLDNPGQVLLEVARANADSAFVPLVDDFIVELDEEEGRIVMNLPKGLLDL